MTEPDDNNTSKITSSAAFAGRDAEASVMFSGASADAEPVDALLVASARAWLLLATELAADDFVSAEAAAREGVENLGEVYLPGPEADPAHAPSDDTETKILAADLAEDDEQRFTLVSRALESRLVMFTWRFADGTVTYDPPLDAA